MRTQFALLTTFLIAAAIASCDSEPFTTGPGSAGSAGAAGHPGGTPPGCIPSETTDPVADTCGVFVSTSGNDSNAGTKDAPYASITAALTAGKTVYVCNQEFSGAINITNNNQHIYGGLDCANGWAYAAGNKSTLSGEADMIPFTVAASVTGVKLEDFTVKAADATLDGGSSIAALVDDSAAVEFKRCELIAGNGKAGKAGTTEPSTATGGTVGNPGATACSADAPVNGGSQVVNNCPNGQSIGGSGGQGDVATGGPGAPGQIGTLGQAGTGQTVFGGGAWSCGVDGRGQDGSNGTDGTPGTAASGTGTLSSTGFAGVNGGDGTIGKPGQGGGGGGGARNQSGASSYYCGNSTQGGASGGSGGTGGCGGVGGGGGQAGGASIALVSINATLILTECALTAGNGGAGGVGGDLQAGGAGANGGDGGLGASGSSAACNGGKGGQGGNGGPGGGGLGGHSLGIAHTGTPPTKDANTTITLNTAGSGSDGGSGNMAANGGVNGQAAETLAL